MLGKFSELGVWSNFGPVHEKCILELNKTMGRYCLPVTSGTTAIEVALKVLLPRGARVLLPDFTHSGTILAVVAAGCIPVLGPVDKKTWTLDLEAIARYPSCFDAMIVVSPFGYKVNFQAYEGLAKDLAKPIVYDLAGAWGKFPETLWPVCYSFHATKNFSIGEGGAVTFGCHSELKKAKQLANFGTLPDRSINGLRGGNYKIDEIRAAMILHQLQRHKEITQRIAAKRSVLSFYQFELSKYCTPHSLAARGTPSLCVLGGVKKAEKIEQRAAEFGISCKRYYPLLSRMYHLQSVQRIGASEEFFENCLALPSDVTKEEMQRVVEFVKLVADGK